MTAMSPMADRAARYHTASRGSRPQLALRTSAFFDTAGWPLYLQKRKVGVRQLRSLERF
jgi:hypothetical protein